MLPARRTHENDLEQHFLVHLHEFLIPLVDVGRLFARIRIVVSGSRRVPLMVSAPFNDLLQDRLVDLTG